MEWKNTMRIFAAAVIAVGLLAFASGCGKKDSTAVAFHLRRSCR